MPECHKCPHNGRANTACLTCRGPGTSLTHHGRAVVSLDALEGAEQPMTVHPLPDQYAIARDAIARIYRIGAKDREVLFRRMAGESYSSIAATIRTLFRCDYTLAAAHRCMDRLIRTDPLIADLFADMREKQRRRKTK